jgi:transketolase
MNAPLSLRNKLAGNPSKDPLYFAQVQHNGSSLKVADPKSTRALVALMDMNAVLGGAASHYGGPAAFAELMSAMHGFVFAEAKAKNKAWYEMFHLINDAGHCENGLYALKANYGFADLTIEKLKHFRSIKSPLSGHGEAHLFPEGVLLSNGPLGSALPQAQGLAMADAMARNNRVTITAMSDGGCMEGEAREAMAAIPGLAQSGKMAPFVMIISDNNTKLSGRIDQESYSMKPTFTSMKALGWKVIEIDGHNLQLCFDTIKQAVEDTTNNPKVPIAIHAKTIKGIGTKKTQESLSGGHGFPLKSPTELPEFIKEIWGADYPKEFQAWIDELIILEKDLKAKATKPAEPEEKIQTGISNAMIKAHKKGHPIVSISADLPGSTGVAGFRKEFPNSSLDVGIAESNMVSAAAGFSKIGYIPVVDTFAQFGVTKGALPLTMASLSEAPIICVFSHTGFQDAADGASHQGLTYLAMLSGIPYVDVYCLSCSEEADQVMTAAIEKFAADHKAGKVPHSTVLFLGRENFVKNFGADKKFELRGATILKETPGKNPVTIAASGSMVTQAILAAKSLEAKGVGSIVVHPGCHNHLETEVFGSALKKTEGRLITVEDHQKVGGFGQMLVFALAEKGIAFKVRSLAVNGEFGQSAYTAQELYAKHGIDSVAIVKAALEL